MARAACPACHTRQAAIFQNLSRRFQLDAARIMFMGLRPVAMPDALTATHAQQSCMPTTRHNAQKPAYIHATKANARQSATKQKAAASQKFQARIAFMEARAKILVNVRATHF